MTKFGLVANMQFDEKISFNIFEMFVGNNELMKKVVNVELYMFKRFQANVNNETMFPIVVFLVYQFLALLVLK
jgi:hypothetical protein